MRKSSETQKCGEDTHLREQGQKPKNLNGNCGTIMRINPSIADGFLHCRYSISILAGQNLNATICMLDSKILSHCKNWKQPFDSRVQLAKYHWVFSHILWKTLPFKGSIRRNYNTKKCCRPKLLPIGSLCFPQLLIN